MSASTGSPDDERRVEHRDDDRRESILAAAQKLFAEKGFRETNLNEVAAELGFRRQAVYHYFPSKETILYELIARAGDSMKASAAPLFDSPDPPDRVLVALVRNHVRVIQADAAVFRIQFSELPKLSGERADALRAEILGYVRRIADVIKAGQDSGVFRAAPPLTQALLIVGMCNGTTDWYAADRSAQSVDDIADYAAALALGGITA